MYKILSCFFLVSKSGSMKEKTTIDTFFLELELLFLIINCLELLVVIMAYSSIMGTYRSVCSLAVIVNSCMFLDNFYLPACKFY